EALAVAERQPELLQIGLGQVGQDIEADIASRERLCIALEPVCGEPGPQLHRTEPPSRDLIRHFTLARVNDNPKTERGGSTFSTTTRTRQAAGAWVSAPSSPEPSFPQPPVR